MGGTIFISYRRGVDAGFAGRLYDRLKESFGREQVFMDVDNIAPGDDFVAVLESRVAACDVLLALIGRDWLVATDEAGNRRLDKPDDFVRVEIGAALAQGKRVIPVVIDNVPMPQARELPEEIKPLARRQAMRVRHDRFVDDATWLVSALKKASVDATAAGNVAAAARANEKEEHQQRAERERQHIAAEAERGAQDYERQRADAEVKRQAAEKDRRQVEGEVNSQTLGEKIKSSRTWWYVGGAILLFMMLFRCTVY